MIKFQNSFLLKLLWASEAFFLGFFFKHLIFFITQMPLIEKILHD